MEPLESKNLLRPGKRKNGILDNVIPTKLNLNAKYFLVGGITNGISNGVFNSVMQLYLISLGFEPTSLGRVFMMNSLGSTLLTVPAGILADRYGKRKMILAGFFFIGLSMILFFTAQTVPAFALSFLLIGICNATGTVLTPLYSSFFEKDDMDKAFSLWGLLNIFAMSIGSLAGYLPALMVGRLSLSLPIAYRYTMLMAAGLFIAQYFFYYISSTNINEILKEDFKFKLNSWRTVLKICGLTLFVNIAGGIMFSFFPYYVNKKFGIESAGLGTMFFISNLVMAMSKGSAASFSKRLGSLKSITLGIATSAIFLLGFPVAPSFAFLSILYILRMGTRFMSDPLVTSLFMKRLDEEEKSTANSLRLISLNGGGVISPWLGGLMIEKIGLESPAYIGGAMTLLASALFPLLLKREIEEERP
ncbi:MFS transporter [Candidatus Bathyarchaeota archaeon]|nr:MFS transporter [Candidatus Bathyarchaeota archaeon]